MGQATRKNSVRIFRSLLALGVFEMKGQPLSGNDIIDSLDSVKINEPEQSKRIIKTIQEWLDEGGELQIIKNKRPQKFKVNFHKISEDKYKEFLDVLLSLYEIGNRQFDSAINKLYDKPDKNALGIISELILASKMQNDDDKKLNILYEYEGNRVEFIFIPKNLEKINESWVVNGYIINNYLNFNPPLDISKIISLK